MSAETDSPFHAGEQAVQAKVGVRERMAELGPRVIRSAMPAQHREFFALLPFVVLGAVDASGQPGATLLAGPEPGFVQSPDDTTLCIDARPHADDPLAASIMPGAALGLLGIELPTRRRNRANGVVAQLDEHGFTLRVQQSFGNCPKYIQQRELFEGPAASAPRAARRADRLDGEAAALLRRADTFFIASHSATGGSDVSHRGGRPGFIQLTDDGRTLSWPDFSGNSFYNTLGNVLLEPRAGLVLPDFASGDLLHVAGRVEIVWDGPEVAAVPGAQRLLRMQVQQTLLRPAALPLRWRLTELSSFLP
jgi:predicted pyridoxine 5'-phosphate oxidase superfamily flavin-nucleotide-binding protein